MTDDETITFHPEVPRDLRELVTRNVVEESARDRDRDGWDQPHALLLVSVHRMDSAHIAATCEPIPFPLEVFPGQPWQQLELLASTMIHYVKEKGETPPIPDGCVGLLFLAESWMSKPVETDGPYVKVMPSEDPQRMEALIATFVDLSGNIASGIKVRGSDELDYFDLADAGPVDRRKMIEGSRIYPSMITLGQLLGAQP